MVNNSVGEIIVRSVNVQVPVSLSAVLADQSHLAILKVLTIIMERIR
jgi:hypothetical protein